MAEREPGRVDAQGADGVAAEVEGAVSAFARGEFVVVVDDDDRENEGDLIVAADAVTPEKITFMVRHTSGLICVPMMGDRLDRLRLPLMVTGNTEAHQTAFTVSTDYRPATTTGISAADRAATIRALCDESADWSDFSRPGHVFPLRYCEGGVLKRAGHTEAAVDLAILAGRYPAGVICEITNADGTMSRGEQLTAFAHEHGLRRLSIADLVRYRRRTEKLVRRVGEARLPTAHGDFTAYAYQSLLTGLEHIALVKGDVAEGAPLVRVHSECLTGDAFGSARCDCGEQLTQAMALIEREGCGVVVYLRGHEGRGIGLGPKLRAYKLQDEGLDTVQANLELGYAADSRQYGVGAQILADLGIRQLRLITNNPAKYTGLAGYGLQIVERVGLPTRTTATNVRYLAAKRDKLGHLLSLDGDVSSGA